MSNFKTGLASHFKRQKDFSLRTFGLDTVQMAYSITSRKELVEIEADPLAIEEWIDVAILAFDGAWRAGHEPEAIVKAWFDKQARNEARQWPDWRTAPTGQAIEHVKTDIALEEIE